jgi:predicted dehydrogenase
MAIRVIVVGLGPRGQEWVQVVRAATGYELAGCVDSAPEALARAARTLGLPEVLCGTDLPKSLETVRPDAVIVATSLGEHGGPCREALARGCGALVEKPFVQSAREAEELVDLAARSKAPLLVAQNFRYMKVPSAARRTLSTGRLGAIGMVVCQAYRGAPVTAPAPGVTLRLLWNIGVHHLDLLRYLLGREAVAVAAQSAALPWNRDGLERSVQVLVRFEGGLQAVYSMSRDIRGHELLRRENEFFLRIFAERGSLHLSHRWLVLCEQGRLPRLLFPRKPRPSPEASLLEQLDRALRTGEETECSGRDNLKTVAVLEACARSVQESRWVNPQELLRESR